MLPGGKAFEDLGYEGVINGFDLFVDFPSLFRQRNGDVAAVGLVDCSESQPDRDQSLDRPAQRARIEVERSREIDQRDVIPVADLDQSMALGGCYSAASFLDVEDTEGFAFQDSEIFSEGFDFLCIHFSLQIVLRYNKCIIQ